MQVIPRRSKAVTEARFGLGGLKTGFLSDLWMHLPIAGLLIRWYVEKKTNLLKRRGGLMREGRLSQSPVVSKLRLAEYLYQKAWPLA